jgi:hypothetical protein
MPRDKITGFMTAFFGKLALVNKDQSKVGTTLPWSLLLNVLNKHNAMTYGGTEVELHVFLTSALDGGERSASCQI